MFHKNELKRYFSTMVERHHIWWLRSTGQEKPWTSVGIFRDYRFCNVFRELDTVTMWIDENIRQRWPENPNLWFALCVGRQINWPETLAELGALLVRFDPDKMKAKMRARQERGDKVFTTAYMITNGGQSKPKIDYIVDDVLTPLWQDGERIRKWMHPRFSQAGEPKDHVRWQRLRKYPGFGKFMAYEVITDMYYTRYLSGCDRTLWANAGPGALRGLNRLQGRPATTSGFRGDDAVEMMRELRSQANGYIASLLNKRAAPFITAWSDQTNNGQLTLRDIEHWLCEYDKYERVRKGEGKPRQRYQGC